jgi:phage terminase Nu1 subunit (DNA packaging protein)
MDNPMAGRARTSTGTPAEQGGLMTRRQLADALDVHMMTVTKWERDGCPIAERGRKGKPSLYREADVRAWRDRRDEAAASGESRDLAIERARKEHWQAQLAEQQFRVRAGTLIPSDQVERVWAHHVAAVRAKLLALPSALCDALARAAVDGGVSAVEETLQVAIYDTLRELSGEAAAKACRKAPARKRTRAKSGRRSR